MANDRTGLLIIRAWTEPGSSESLRAQVRLTTDVSAGFEPALTFARSEMVCATVQEWLASFLGDAPGSTSDETPRPLSR